MAFPVDSVLGFLIYHILDWTTLPLIVGLILAFHRRFHDLSLISVQRFGFDIMLHVLIHEGLVDEDFIRERTVGWEEARAMAEQYPPERVAKVCGLRPEAIIEAARLYGRARPP